MSEWWTADPIAPAAPTAPSAPAVSGNAMLDNALKPFTSYPSTYTGMKNDALGMMGEGVNQITRGTPYDIGMGAGKTALGGLGYVASPINAALRTVVGQPIQDNTGIPREYSEFAASMALPVPKRVPNIGGSKPAAPSIEQLKDAARAGYASDDVTGLAIRPATVVGFAQQTKASLNAMGLDDVVAPAAFNILNKLEKAPDGSFVSGQSLDSLRKVLGNAAKETNARGQPTPNAAAATHAIQQLDEFIPKMTGRDVVAGDPKAAAATWDTARKNWGAAARSEMIDRKSIQAELRAAAANSGTNVANTMRQRMADILLKPELKAGYNADELAQMESIVRGTTAQNTLRGAGNLLGGGGGLGAMVSGAVGGMATASHGGIGFALPIVGYGLRALGNRLTVNQVEKLSEAVRSNAPLAKSMEDFSEKLMQAETSRSARTLTRLATSAQNLSYNLKDAGVPISPADLFKALQGPAKGGAETDK